MGLKRLTIRKKTDSVAGDRCGPRDIKVAFDTAGHVATQM
jgi:hypothetical protein